MTSQQYRDRAEQLATREAPGAPISDESLRRAEVYARLAIAAAIEETATTRTPQEV